MTALKQTWDNQKNQVFSIIKQNYESGAKLSSIASKLNDLGLKSKTNKSFNKSIVCFIALYDLKLPKRVEQSKHVFKKNTTVQESVYKTEYNQAQKVVNDNVQGVSDVVSNEIHVNLPTTLFYFENMDIRTITKEDGSIWFCAKDVCAILDIKNHADAISNIKQNHKVIVSTDTLGGLQNMSYVSEAGLYKLIFVSRKENAEVFQDWVTGVVIPSIRKTGSYSIQKPKSTIEILQGSINELARIDNEVKSINKDLVDLKSFRTESLLEPERSLIIPLQKETRAKVRDLVDWYVAKSIDVGHKVVWNKLYKEFLLRYKINVKSRAKDKKISTLSYIETINRMEELFAIASEILVFPMPVVNNTGVQIQQMNFLKEA